MGILWGLIAVILAFAAIVTVYDVIRRHLGAGKTAAWILLVVILPLIGTIVYWTMRPPTGDEIERTVDADREAREGHPRPQSTRFRA